MSMSVQTSVDGRVERDVRSVCPACGSADVEEGIRVPDHEYGLSYVPQYKECGACGTLFQEPMPTLEELASFYPADYHSMTHGGLLSRIRNGVRIRRLAKLMTGEGAILDYGCGDGGFLVQAAEKLPGRRFWGYEIADGAETIVLAGGAVTLVKGAASDLFAALPLCSLITLNHVIEHLPDPFAIVKQLVEKLTPGGVFEGQTPAADSLERSVFGTHWSGYHAPRHTVVFSRRGLRSLLERAGLSSPILVGAFNPASLAISLGSLSRGGAGRIHRSGLKWFCLLALGGMLGPVDLLSGRPGITDFVAQKDA
jgi:hypothetical protein